MGLMDLFNGFDSGSGLMGMLGGLSGSEEEMQEKILKKLGISPNKPGKMCVRGCTVNDSRCEACLAEQAKVQAVLDEMKSLEVAFETARNNPQPRIQITKCTLCGAPLETSGQSCPYCDTPYPAGTFAPEIPTSETDLDDLLLQKASETYIMYSKLRKQIMETTKKDLKSKPSLLSGFTSIIIDAMNLGDMTTQEIKRLAKQNNVSYRDYIEGVIQGTYMTSTQAMTIDTLEKSNKKMDEVNERLREQNQQRLQELQAKTNSSHSSMLDIRARRYDNWDPGYNGGSGGTTSSGICCGTCANYMTSGKCAAGNGRNGYVSASDRRVSCHVRK